VTLEECVIAALSRAEEYGNEWPGTRSVFYRRVGVREQQLMVRAAEINQDFFGKSVSINLVAGVANLATLNPVAERVAGARINGVGTSAYATGTRVTIVPIDDPTYSGLAPRATLRDYTLTQVGADLALVASVWIDYSKRPTVKALATDVPEIPLHFHELLVLDLVKWMVRKSSIVDTKQRLEIAARLSEEETELLADYDEHVERFQTAEESRFGRTARSISKPKKEE
jgi:hypothetical protein